MRARVHLRQRVAVLWVVALLTPLALTVQAEPLRRSEVPAPLEPWVDWVLRDAKDAVCPFVHSRGQRRQCVWPSRLELVLEGSGGSFRQEWTLHRESWVPLPGGSGHWPESVRVDAQPAVVVARGGVPSLRLPAGTHRVRGRFVWPSLPEGLQVPPETGLLSLALSGRGVVFPRRDLSGRLWLQSSTQEDTGESRLDVTVHRRVLDEVPLRLETEIRLKVSGPGREVELGPALPAGFVAMQLDSVLPARVENSDRLRVQVRPGDWRLFLVARHEGPAESLAYPPAEPPWDAEEVWVFEAHPELRLVEVEDVPAIDPQQTTLPGGWRHLPAYLMKEGSRMRLVERRRGDADPAPDRIQLERTFWLDFDGGGYTVRDQLSGSLRRSWRLEMAPGTRLGRVSVSGRDEFITHLGDPNQRGIEVRQGNVQIEADSRIEGDASRLPAVGWLQDVHALRARLNLPPGWRLFHASGVDDVHSTWITGWSLLEFFGVLVTAMAVVHLWGRAWGLLALLTLVLIYPEAGAPRLAWLFPLAAQALLRVVPEGRARRWLQLIRIGALTGLVMLLLPFAVQQLRQAVYPALEFPHQIVHTDAKARNEAARGRLKAKSDAPASRPAEAPGFVEDEAVAQLELRRESRKGVLSSMAPGRGLLQHYAPDPAALVSTGPGLPAWSWRVVRLGWRGPVERSQEVRLWLVPPWLSALLGFLRTALVTLLLLCVLDLGGPLRRWLARAARRTPTAAAIGLGMLVANAPIAAPAAADFPSPELLKELRAGLLAQPECFPECASSPRLALEISDTHLRARMQIEVSWATAVPLPGGAADWVPETVLLDGVPAPALARSPDGLLWIQLDPGRHQVVLAGPLPDRDAVQLPLPLRPHRVSAKVSGWVLAGIGEDGRPEGSLQLVRTRAPTMDGTAAEGSRTLEPDELPAFVRVERALRLGLSWQVETTVTRLTPLGRALFLEVPLLAGESVTTEGIRVENGRAGISLPPNVSRTRWTSLLSSAADIELRAPEGVSWTEVWRLDVSPVWHVEVSGIPLVHRPDGEPLRVREWRPWPGESVRLALSRPEGAEGRTLTIDRSSLTLRPGLRASDATLELTLRASRGVQHALTLPASARLQSVKIDGQLQPVRQTGQQISLAIRPGRHRVEVIWRSPEGIATRYRTPEVDLGAPAVNVEIVVAVPADRWVLLVGGPPLGPAVLFWSLLAVVLGLALGLGRLPLTPLSATSWFLLLVGLTQIPIPFALIVIGWLVALGWRRGHTAEGRLGFNSAQVLLVFWTLAAGVTLLFAIQQSLLGVPDMQIRGNGSSGALLRWYQDRSDATLPSAWALSVPLGVYRLVMLAWALWLARALLGWLRWGWECFSSEGLWRGREPEKTQSWD